MSHFQFPVQEAPLGTGRRPGIGNWQSAIGNARAFTLIELLVVISIMGILAAIALPNLGKMKPSVTAAATQQLLADVGRARQLAINNRTTVYMVFLPTNFWATISTATNIQPLFDKQMTSYAFVSLRSIGDQPGQPTARYLSPWRTLPDGTFIPQWKFYNNGSYVSVYTNGSTYAAFNIAQFNYTTRIPFPEAGVNNANGNDTVWLPYIAFDSTGQLVYDNGQPMGYNELIPLAKGSLLYARDPATKVMLSPSPPSIAESPRGNSTNSFTLINIDWLTGRPHAERQEVQ